MRAVSVASLRAEWQALGAGSLHLQRLLRDWLDAQPLTRAAPRRPVEGFYPQRLCEALPAIEAALAALLRVDSVHPAEDGAERLLLRLADGQAIESVLLPKSGLCVSSQVGCAVGCTFCMTGREGLQRQLGSAEILAQVVAARRRRPVQKVVFMGMGEPAHNLDAVLEAIELLGTLGGIAHKKLVFSTVGDARVFERLPLGPVKPALALSLHSTDAALRAELLPRAPRIEPAELAERAELYARATGYPIQYQWTLLEGINDTEEEMAGIVRLLRGRYAMMNLIPFNRVEGTPYRRPRPDRAAALLKYLRSHGIVATLRRSAGQDVDGGCGQLRARAEAATVRILSSTRETPWQGATG